MKKYLVFVVIVAILVAEFALMATVTVKFNQLRLIDRIPNLSAISDDTLYLKEYVETMYLPYGYKEGTKVEVVGKFYFMDAPQPQELECDCSCLPKATVTPTETPTTVPPTNTPIPPTNTSTPSIVPTNTSTPSIVPTNTSTPTPEPPVGNIIINPGDKVGSDAIHTMGGYCTYSFTGWYNKTGAYYGKQFGITNAHCVTDPNVGYNCPACSGKPFWALNNGAWKNIGNTAYWYPSSVVSGGVYRYDAGAVEGSVDTKFTSNVGGVAVNKFIGWVDNGTVLYGNGARGGAREAKVIGNAACVRVYVDEEVYYNFCSSYMLEGINSKAMQPGDSGTLFVLNSNKSTAVCLGFAGNETGMGICSEIDEVLSGMHLSLTKP